MALPLKPSTVRGPPHLLPRYLEPLFLSETMDIFCLAGSVQQAQIATHLAEASALRSNLQGLESNPIVT